MTRLELVNQILNILKRGDCSSALALTFLNQGIRRVERQLRTPATERVSHINIVANTSSVTMPGDCLEVIDVVSGGLPLTKVSHRDLIGMGYGHAGHWVGSCPRVYSQFGTGIYLHPAVMAGGDVLIAYYGTIPPLTSDDDSNEASRMLSELMTYAALTYAADYFRHDEGPNWSDKYNQLLGEAQDEATQIKWTGGSMAVQSPYGDY